MNNKRRRSQPRKTKQSQLRRLWTQHYWNSRSRDLLI